MVGGTVLQVYRDGRWKTERREELSARADDLKDLAHELVRAEGVTARILTRYFDTKERDYRWRHVGTFAPDHGDGGPTPVAAPAVDAATAHRAPDLPALNAHVIVVGCQKGGTGKSTLAIHIAVALSLRDFQVAALDLDADQQSLVRFFDNRVRYGRRHNNDTPIVPVESVQAVAPITRNDRPDAAAEERARLTGLLQRLSAEHDFIVVDTPGARNELSSVAHMFADTIVTPINDSFLDLDLLAKIEMDDGDDPSIVEGPYLRMVETAQRRRSAAGREASNWLVCRNRLGNLASRNKVEMDDCLRLIATRFGFRTGPGIGERVAYRDCFRSGVTIFDRAEIAGASHGLDRSRAAALTELTNLFKALDLPDF